jgi:integrase
MRIEPKFIAGMTVQLQGDQLQSTGPVYGAPVVLKAKASSQRGGKLTRPSFQKGSIGGPYRTKHGTAFDIRYRIRSGDGKPVHKSQRLYVNSKKEAWAILQDRVRDSRNEVRPLAQITVSEFIKRYWRPYLDRQGVKPSTRAGYESGVRQLLPVLGDLRLVDVTPIHIEDIATKKLQSGASPKTVRNMITFLHGIFALAVDQDLIQRSPVRQKHKPKLKTAEKTIWTAEQIRSILAAAAPEHRCLLMALALTGARIGEILALQWKHIDFAAQRLDIRQSIWNGQIGEPKTAAGVRGIYLVQALKEACQEHWAKASHRRPEHFVFCRLDGSPLSPDVLRRDVLYPALDRAGIPRNKRSAGFHAFRHSAASFINAGTGNIKAAQKLLGHANPDITAAVYTPTQQEEDRQAALAVERAIYPDLFGNVRQIGLQNNNGLTN